MFPSPPPRQEQPLYHTTAGSEKLLGYQAKIRSVFLSAIIREAFSYRDGNTEPYNWTTDKHPNDAASYSRDT